MSIKPHILVVDDEELNRKNLESYLTKAGYRVTLATDGEQGWERFENEKEGYAAVLLNRVMSRLDGMDLLARIKSDSRFSYTPVILQTTVDDVPSISEGIQAGAFFYLIKPFNPDVALAILRSAVDAQATASLRQAEAERARQEYTVLLCHAKFRFRTLYQARLLAERISAFHPEPQRSLVGVSELLINAVEHGNLGITYAEKSALLRAGGWEQEVERRLEQPQYAQREVEVILERDAQTLTMTITLSLIRI